MGALGRGVAGMSCDRVSGVASRSPRSNCRWERWSSGWDATHSVLTLVTADSGSDVAIPSKPEPFEHTCADGGAAWVDGALEVSTGIGRMDATVSLWVHLTSVQKGGRDQWYGPLRQGLQLARFGSRGQPGWGWDPVWQGAVEGACEVDLSGVVESDHAVIGRHLVEMEQE